MKKTLILLSVTSSILLANTPLELLKTKCASCHILTTPTASILPTLKAPAIEAVMLHLKVIYE